MKANIHDLNDCMCDLCITTRKRQDIAARQEEQRKREFESASQDYIRRRGGIDPRK